MPFCCDPCPGKTNAVINVLRLLPERRECFDVAILTMVTGIVKIPDSRLCTCFRN